MRTRIYLWIFAAAVLLAPTVWIFWDRPSTGSDHARIPTTNHQSAAIAPVQPKTNATAIVLNRLEEKNRKRLEAEGERLVKAARNALESGGNQDFEKFIIEIIHRYKGDPNPLLLRFSDVLEHVDPHLRIRMAGYFLLTNLKADEAVQVLRDTLRTDEPLMYGPDRSELLDEVFPASDYRFRAADILALYRIEKARDDVWALYKKTNSKELLRPLRRLNDPRMIEELKGDALKKLGSIENMKLIGEFRMEEALPDLRSKYEDEDLHPDARFTTLYPLWRITGEEKYFDEFAAAFSPAKIPVTYLAVDGDKERDYLVAMLETEGSDTLYKAAMALHLRHEYDNPLIEVLTEYFHDVQSSNWKDGVLARRLVGSIDDPELTRVAEEYERKYQTGFHDRYVVYRKNWRYPEWEEAFFMD